MNIKIHINAVLVKLSIPVFPNTRTDHGITNEVKTNKKLGIGAGEWKKNKLPKAALSGILKFAGQIRKFHYAHTCVWEDGQQLLSVKARPSYDAQMDKFAVRFWQLVDAFGLRYCNPHTVPVKSAAANAYLSLAANAGQPFEVPDGAEQIEIPSLIKQAKLMHRETYNSADYPAWEEMRQRFDISREYSPVPQPEHFNPDMQKLYGAGLETITEKKVADAIADAWKRLFEPVKNMAETLANPETIFRDSLVSKVQEIVKTAEDLNLNNDPKFKEAVTAISSQLANYQPDLLRKDKVMRKDAAEKAKALAERFGAMGARKFAA